MAGASLHVLAYDRELQIQIGSRLRTTIDWLTKVNTRWRPWTTHFYASRQIQRHINFPDASTQVEYVEIC